MPALFYIALAVLTAAATLCLYRIAAGPGLIDEAAGILTFSILLVGFLAAIAVETRCRLYLHLVLAWIPVGGLAIRSVVWFIRRANTDE